jgi:hypothetical protein
MTKRQDRHRPTANCPAAKAEIPELMNVRHVFVKAAARLNSRAENSHQPTRDRERRRRGFRDPKLIQKFLWCFGLVRQHFALKRHLLRVSLLYPKQLAARFVAWREFTNVTQTRLTLSEVCASLPSFLLRCDKLTMPVKQITSSLLLIDALDGGWNGARSLRAYTAGLESASQHGRQ